MNKNNHLWVYVTMGAALIVLFFFSLVYGAVRIPLGDVLRILSGSYGGREAWRHIVLESRLPQAVTALLSGGSLAVSGLMLRTLCGLQRPLGGEILIESRPLADYRAGELSARVGVVLTERTQAGGISVYELVSLGRYPHTGFFGTLGEKDHAIVREAMDAVGIAGKAEKSVAELSDGERQKAFIAKVLAQECPIILLDEPTAFLDVTSRIETMATLRHLAHTQDKALLLSTHDLDTALQLADRLWLQPACTEEEAAGLRPAAPLICGTPETLIEDGSLAGFFGTEAIRFDPESRRLVV